MKKTHSPALKKAVDFLKDLGARYQVDPSFLERLQPSVEQIFEEFDEVNRIPLLAVVEQSVERRAIAEQGARELRLAADELRAAHRKFADNARDFRASVASVIRRPTDN
jgi:hypothetical protein